MEFEKLFTAVVVGGSLLAGGCAKQATETTATTAPPAQSAQATPEDAAPTPVDTKNTENEADTSVPADTKKAEDNDAAVNCDEVCDGGEGRERICPDPSQNDIENCCWLMLKRHECCEG